LVASSFLVAADPVKPKDREFTSEELELIRICDEWQTAVNQWNQEAQEIKDEGKQELFLQEKFDSAPFVTQLIAFEKAHHGTPVGLMAVRRLTHMAMHAYRPESPGYQAASHVFQVVRHYGEHAELTEVVRFLELCPRPEVENTLRSLAANEIGVSANNRDFAKYTLAGWIVQQRDNGDYLKNWLADVDAGKFAATKWLRDDNAGYLNALVPLDRMSSLVPEAIDILEKLVASGTDARRIGGKQVNGNYNILQADAEVTQRTMPRVKDLATGLLFKEKHLQFGRPMPDLKVKLISGEEFDFAKQRGKVLVVQFSFTGCGPCQATYPQLKNLAATFPDRLAVLTFMCDPEPDDAKTAVSSGKITWNVSWDGVPGVQATGWGVGGYPTLYVFGSDGLLAERLFSPKNLQEKVAALLK
jgi:thiol-disulfide isomerase/thioredoxin